MNETIIAQLDLIEAITLGAIVKPTQLTLFLNNGKAAIFGVEGDDVTLVTRPITAEDTGAFNSALSGYAIVSVSHDVQPIRMTLNLSNGMSHKFHVASGKLIVDAFETPADGDDEDSCPECGRAYEEDED